MIINESKNTFLASNFTKITTKFIEKIAQKTQKHTFWDVESIEHDCLWVFRCQKTDVLVCFWQIYHAETHNKTLLMRTVILLTGILSKIIIISKKIILDRERKRQISRHISRDKWTRTPPKAAMHAWLSLQMIAIWVLGVLLMVVGIERTLCGHIRFVVPWRRQPIHRIRNKC